MTLYLYRTSEGEHSVVESDGEVNVEHVLQYDPQHLSLLRFKIRFYQSLLDQGLVKVQFAVEVIELQRHLGLYLLQGCSHLC